VYAITTGRQVPDVPGILLRSIRVGALSALVSDTRRTPKATARALRRYQQRQAAMADQLPAMLPVRFGTVIEESEVAFILKSRSAALGSALRQVRGHVQFTMRIRAEQAAPDPARPVRTPRQVRSGAAYLRARAADVARARHVPGFDPVRHAVARWVKDEQVVKQAGIASVYHLVPRRSAAAYARTLAAAADAAGVRVIISGPFPPYAFSTL
jgi:hypothetical protein